MGIIVIIAIPVGLLGGTPPATTVNVLSSYPSSLLDINYILLSALNALLLPLIAVYSFGIYSDLYRLNPTVEVKAGKLRSARYIVFTMLGVLVPILAVLIFNNAQY